MLLGSLCGSFSDAAQHATVAESHASGADDAMRGVNPDIAPVTGTLPDFLPNPRHRPGMTDIDLHLQQAAEWDAHAQLPMAADTGASTGRAAADRGVQSRHDQGPPRRAASDRLRTTDQLRAVQGAENIRLNLDEYSLWARDGHVTVGKLWEYYCQYPYMPRLTERPVLEQGILAVFDSLTWEAHDFALATGYEDNTGRYTGLAIPHEDPIPQLTDTTLLVQPDRAHAQRDAERAAAAEAARAAAEAAARAGGNAAGTGDGEAAGPGDGSAAGGGPGSGTALGGTPAPGGFPPPPPPHPRTRVSTAPCA
jgi:hypothetical protein